MVGAALEHAVRIHQVRVVGKAPALKEALQFAVGGVEEQDAWRWLLIAARAQESLGKSELQGVADNANSLLESARERLQYLMTVTPAIVYTNQASDYTCTFVSENLRAIMGYSPEEMTTDPKSWPDHLHPEDAPRVFEKMPPLIERGGGTRQPARSLFEQILFLYLDSVIMSLIHELGISKKKIERRHANLE